TAISKHTQELKSGITNRILYLGFSRLNKSINMKGFIMLGVNGYKTKKDLKSAIGKELNFYETSLFCAEYTPNGKVTVVGPCAYTKRPWYAQVTLENGIIKKVT